MIDINACREALWRFAGKRVLVVGDLMLDEHIWGTVGRISPEAPVMVVEVDSPEDCLPGGAANVANNIRALGGEASIIGIIGNDEGGHILLERLKEAGVDVSGVLVDPERPTTRKTRIWASHRHQVVRVDRESRKPISKEIVAQMISCIENAAKQADAILLSDYDKGVISRELAQSAIRAARDAGVISASNPKPRNLACFEGVGVMTLNQSEASTGADVEISGKIEAETAGRKLVGNTHCAGLVITRGGKGLSVFDGAEYVEHIPAVQSEVYDVAGAGDTVVSALTLSLASGLDLVNSAAIANCSGGAVVRKVGVATTNVEEISTILDSINP